MNDITNNNCKGALKTFKSLYIQNKLMVLSLFIISIVYAALSFSNLNLLAVSGAGRKTTISDQLDAVLLSQSFGILILISTVLLARHWIKKSDNLGLELTLMAGVFLIYFFSLNFVLPFLIGPDIMHMLHMSESFGIQDKYSYLATTLILTALSFQPGYFGIWVLLFMLLANLMLATIILLRGLKLKALYRYIFFLLSFLWPYSLFLFSYANRDTLFCIVLSAAILSFAGLVRFPNKTFLKVTCGFLSGMVCVMRPEAIVMAPIILFALWVASAKTKQFALGVLPLALLLGLNTALPSAFFSSFKTSQTYAVTGYLSPLLSILESDKALESIDLTELELIYSVINKETAKASTTNIPAFFDGSFDKKMYSDNSEAFDRVARGIILNNPDIFLKNRLLVFLATMGFGDASASIPFQSPRKIVDSNWLKGENPTEEKILETRQRFNMLSKISSFNPLSLGLWNFVLAILLHFYFLVSWKRNPITSILVLALFARSGAVFLTAPASFTFYYASFQTALFPLLLLLIVERHRKFGSVKT